MSRGSEQRIRVLVIAGARPNFMKVAPLLRELQARPRFETRLVHTGQHYDASMSDAFFEDLGIPRPDLNLEVGSGSHATQTAEVLRRIEPVLLEEAPHALVVVGDVNSTLACALAASKLGIPVAHVEAGLRSGDRSMPEEINRLLTDAISDWLFTTEPAGRENLVREGVAPGKIHFVGNVMIDTLYGHLERARSLDTLSRLSVEPGGYALLTLHRPANVDHPERFGRLLEALETLHQEIPILFPVHPRTRESARRLLDREIRMRLLEPLGYLDMLRLLVDARLVLTDSGGLQEETTALQVPCLTLRDNTERPITLEEGTNVLVGADPDRILSEARRILAGGARRGQVPELWDGLAAKRIVDVLEQDLEERA